MKVVIAPDSFKGTMSALQAARAIAEGVRKAIPDAQIVLMPLADGGEGTVDALVASVPGSLMESCEVRGPLGDPVVAHFGLLGKARDVAVVEMAAASGLTLVETERRDPMRSSTYGTGQLIRWALASPGVRHLIIGLGGSATNDGGAGALAALGVRFVDSRGITLPSFITPLNLGDAVWADESEAIKSDVVIELACDVSNSLCGSNGASHVFGAQKGASPANIVYLDSVLQGFAEMLDALALRRGANAHCVPEGLATLPGGGAAGGLAAGLFALFPNATMRPGIDLVLDTANFDQLIASADLVITGEGRLDEQTLAGKTICGVLRRTSVQSIRTIALAGSVEKNAVNQLRSLGLDNAFGIIDIAADLADAMSRGPELLSELAYRAIAPIA